MKEEMAKRKARRTLRTPAATLLTMLFAALTLAAACGEPEPVAEPRPDADAYTWPEGPHPVAVLEIEGFGEIEVELYPGLAPSTVKNFTKLSQSEFYDGTTFHRVIPDLMIQGGDPNTKDADPSNDGDGGPGWKIQDEFSDAPHVRGVLSMANTGVRNTGGSQFFILHGDAPHLDGRHTIFGRVTRGMNVVDAITSVEIDRHGRWGAANRPVANISITRVVVHRPGERAQQSKPAHTPKEEPTSS